jgi:protein-S-isoprenylcysteine O-methyltransferase
MAEEVPLDPNGAATDTPTSGTMSDRPSISWPAGRPEQSRIWTPTLDEDVRRRASSETPNPTVPHIPYGDLLPGRKRSQSGIATRSFLLGISLGVFSLLAVYCIFVRPTRLWRPCFFMAALSLFHFLEFWTHARYNVPNATISTFLLFTNGIAYTAAHTIAMTETIITSIFFLDWQARFSYPWLQAIGLVLVVVGQVARTQAMITAGTNFHHNVQSKHNEGHVLVTKGIYGILRHPSYFGFFWWAVGTQVVLGNLGSFFFYVLVLWKFFSRRIKGELFELSTVGHSHCYPDAGKVLKARGAQSVTSPCCTGPEPSSAGHDVATRKLKRMQANMPS